MWPIPPFPDEGNPPPVDWNGPARSFYPVDLRQNLPWLIDMAVDQHGHRVVTLSTDSKIRVYAMGKR